MNDYEQIKKLLEASRSLLGNDLISEDVKRIKKSYGLITEIEEEGSPVTDKINIMKDIDSEINYETAKDDEDEEEPTKSDKKVAYRISGGILVLHGKEKLIPN